MGERASETSRPNGVRAYLRLTLIRNRE